MAKKRRVKQPPVAQEDDRPSEPSIASVAPPSSGNRLQPMLVAAGLLGAACIYATYHPSDSIAVEEGDGLWFCVIALLIGTITWAASFWQGGFSSPDRGKADLLIDMIPWTLAIWITISAFATSPPGNLREATNEAWLWIAGAAVFTSARRLMSMPQTQRALLTLIVACASGLAVHGLHQQFVSLPQSRADYREDPEAMLRELGLVAPEGSAQRMVFENRLRDGGPTGTFALANSMAAVLLLGVVVSVGVVGFRLTKIDNVPRLTWCALLVLCMTSLIAARSRSATLAVIIAGVLIFVIATVTARGPIGSKAKLLLKSVVAIGLIAFVSLLGLAAFGNAEWLAQAPASLAFRLQYWRSTLALAFDRPLFAAGPGNFQSIYLQYREPSANEQIAEPHNFLMETLASGGLFAFVMLVGLGSCMAWVYFNSKKAPEQPHPASDGSANWVWMGAGAALALTWLMGAASGRLPDYQAHVFIVPVAIALFYGAWPVIRDMSQREIDSIASVTLIALLIHLLASGGWTIPGVAIHVWMLAAIGCPVALSSESPSAESKPARHWAIASIAIGILLLAALRWMSLGPVQDAQLAIANAEYYQSQNQLRRAQTLLDQAIEADPWSPHAAMWRADMLHWQLVRERDSAETRRVWEQFLEMTRLRGGEDASLWEAIGHQQLHLYQRYGKDADLAAADGTFTRVVQWNPWDPRAVAQLAAIAESAGDQPRAQKMARLAEHLAGLGNNIERALERQLIYVPKPVGRNAVDKPVLATANDLLANHLLNASVSP